MLQRMQKTIKKLAYTYTHSDQYHQAIILQTSQGSGTEKQHGILIPQPPKTPGLQPGKRQGRATGRARGRGPRGHPRARRRDAPVQQGADRDSHGHSHLECRRVGLTRSARTWKRCRSTTLTHLVSHSGRPSLDTVPGSGIVLPGGANIYYLDLAPHSDSPMVRITPLAPKYITAKRRGTKG